MAPPYTVRDSLSSALRGVSEDLTHTAVAHDIIRRDDFVDHGGFVAPRWWRSRHRGGGYDIGGGGYDAGLGRPAFSTTAFASVTAFLLCIGIVRAFICFVVSGVDLGFGFAVGFFATLRPRGSERELDCAAPILFCHEAQIRKNTDGGFWAPGVAP